MNNFCEKNFRVMNEESDTRKITKEKSIFANANILL